MKKILFLFLFLLIACKPSYVKSILPESQVSSSLTISEGRLIAFLENRTKSSKNIDKESYKALKNYIYKKYGPATTELLILSIKEGNVRINNNQANNNVSWLVEIEKLPKPFALLIYDGKNKPIIELNSDNYVKILEKYFKDFSR